VGRKQAIFRAAEVLEIRAAIGSRLQGCGSLDPSKSTRLVRSSEPPLRRQEVLRKSVGGGIVRDRLRKSIQGVGPEFHAVDIGTQPLNGLAQILPRWLCC
jgi:hypothetical protein